MKQNLRQIKALDFVSRDAWSLRTLDRTLEYFGIKYPVKYTDRTVQVDEVEEAVEKEIGSKNRTDSGLSQLETRTMEFH